MGEGGGLGDAPGACVGASVLRHESRNKGMKHS